MCLFFNVSPVFCFHMYNFMFCFFLGRVGFLVWGFFFGREDPEVFHFFLPIFIKL